MNDDAFEQESRREFSAFIAATPVSPRPVLDQRISQQVAAVLRPNKQRVLGKMMVIQTGAGAFTLLGCPQFGVGFGYELALLTELHLHLWPWAFYVLCGGLFVCLGGLLCGLGLTRAEKRRIHPQASVFFASFAALAYAAFMLLGPERFWMGTLFWLPGAFAGNLLGYWAAAWLRACWQKLLSIP